MKARNPLGRLLLVLTLGALLLAGLALGTSMESSDSLAATPATTQAEPAADDVVEDDVVLVARRKRHTRIIATRVFGMMGENLVVVDVNPTLKGKKSYKVVLKVKQKGTWVKCATKRTRNIALQNWGSIGREPDEIVRFDACRPNKSSRKYRVIVPAQHGFLRTVVTGLRAPDDPL